MLGAEDLVTGIAKARHDIAVLVQALVDRRGVDLHVRVGFFHRFDAFRRGHQDHGTDFLAAGLLQQVDGGDHRTAGGQHRVDDQGQALVDVRGELFQVGVGFEGFFVAGNADRADLGPRDQAEHPVEHADAGAQDRHHGNLLASDLFSLHLAAPAVDLVGFQRQVLGRFVGQERADFLGEFAKILGADIGTAHQAELVADQRMADLTSGHRGLRKAGKKTGLD